MIRLGIMAGALCSLVFVTAAEAARCPAGQIYRVSKQKCQSKAEAIRQGVKIRSVNQGGTSRIGGPISLRPKDIRGKKLRLRNARRKSYRRKNVRLRQKPVAAVPSQNAAPGAVPVNAAPAENAAAKPVSAVTAAPAAGAQPKPAGAEAAAGKAAARPEKKVQPKIVLKPGAAAQAVAARNSASGSLAGAKSTGNRTGGLEKPREQNGANKTALTAIDKAIPVRDNNTPAGRVNNARAFKPAPAQGADNARENRVVKRAILNLLKNRLQSHAERNRHMYLERATAK